MSFLDTLKNLGLWQGQGQGQPQQPQANAYGLDQQAMRQAGLSALGNIGGQIMALSQQMTPEQRARMMAGADWTGGLQTNLYNAAQMKLMGDASKRKQQEADRDRKAQEYILGIIKTNPNDPRAKKAAIYAQLGDWSSAGKALTDKPDLSATQEKIALLEQSGVDRNTAIGIATGRFHVTTDPYTNTQRITDLGGNAVSAPSQAGAAEPQSSPSVMPSNAPVATGDGLTPEQLAQGTQGIDARKAADRAIVDRNVDLRTNADGAISFLTKVKKAEGTMSTMTDSDFGPIQGDRDSAVIGTANTLIKPISDWWYNDNSLGRQDLYQRDLSDLELDVAKMKLKGGGSITTDERKIARQTLGGLTSSDKATAEAALQATKVEAALKIRDAIRAKLMTERDLVASGIDPNEIVQILVGAGALTPDAAKTDQSAVPKVKIRQISPGAK